MVVAGCDATAAFKDTRHKFDRGSGRIVFPGAAKKAELLKWATGWRGALGGFAKLHGQDGVLRLSL